MDNATLIKQFELTARLLELHDENPFRVKTYSNAVFALEKITEPLENLSVEQLTQLEGIGKSLAEKMVLLHTEGTFPELQDLLARTPEGVIDMLGIKGIGPKKVKTLWKDAGIDTLEALLEACHTNQVAAMKGFGEKTQETIRQALLFRQQSQGKMHFAVAEKVAHLLHEKLTATGLQVAITGQIARKLPVIEQLQMVVATTQPAATQHTLDTFAELKRTPQTSGVFAWRGLLVAESMPVEILLTSPDAFARQVFIYSSSEAHLSRKTDTGQTLLKLAKSAPNAEAVYTQANLPYIVPEMREGIFEFDWIQRHTSAELITPADLKGILHNHTTYSDGSHTLEEMATYCQSLGYGYVGITDHSKSAFYANGLQENRVLQQHTEINALNQKLAPFRIFKGIESDILNDGSLDYDADILARFDFVIASVHSNLGMDEEKATQRLIRAIENPYTTMLGHPTGRLLLRREGYPIDHRKVIDACAANGVCIEINANPWRLDIDWHWIPYCMEKDVWISINPDAHEKAGYHDMLYGIHVARKGGLTKDKTFNALSANEVAAFFQKRKLL